jgi:hypothetical protein
LQSSNKRSIREKTKGTADFNEAFRTWRYSLAKGEAGTLRIDLVASSSQSGEIVINEFMTAYGKRVPTK